MSDNQLEFCTSISWKNSENGNFWAISIFSSSKVEIDLGKKFKKLVLMKNPQILLNFYETSSICPKIEYVGQFDQVSS